MAKEVETVTVERDSRLGSCLLWFFWGISLSFMTILSLVLVVLFLGSIVLNLYLGWSMSGLEVSVSRNGVQPQAEAVLPIPTEVLAAIPTQTPAPIPTLTPTPVPTQSLLETQLATVSAIATEIAQARSDAQTGTGQEGGGTPVAVVPTGSLPAAVPIGTPGAETSQSEPVAEDAAASEFAAPATSPTPVPTATLIPYEELTSSNSYELFPINGQRESRPPEEHGDLNLKLREPQEIDVELALVDVGEGVDPDAIKLSDIFEPEFTAAYTVHNWDWACNCKGELLDDEEVVLVSIKTTPGEPIFIPTREQDIYGGEIYATLLYASEDSLTFVYAREGTIAMGYGVHYVGLRTDPNLLKLYQESQGNELPGLTLDTPVGIATDELLVAIRDNGKFLDVRSVNDWWD